ncbi:hypothetical protein PMAYCL1PPCAC_15434, partial [Pristionchus mayeri]
MSKTLERRKRVCVVGAGAAGLPSIRHALLYGFEVVCYEGQGDIGGLWRYKPEETNESSVMKSTVINSSKELTAYSDFPPKAEDANFMHNRHMCQYLVDYANNFKLTEYIKLWHKVQNVERADDYAKTGRWNVTVSDLKSGTSFAENFDGVFLCTGHHTLPHWPQPWQGQNEFKGQIIHAHSYKDHKGLEDKVVAVVGVGNSGGDVAVELSKIAKQVYLITRRGTWVFNRIFDYGRPVDCALNTRFFEFFRNNLPHWFTNGVMKWQLNRRFDHELYRLKPAHGVFGAHPTVNDELPNRIAAGTVRVKPQISKFTERGLVFEDGSKAEEVDTVVVATGYSFEFPILEKGELVKVEENVVDLFEYIFPLACEHDTLGIIGLIQPYGSIMPIAEMQARVVLDVLAGRSKLPTTEERKALVRAKHEEMDCRYVKSRRHTIQVDYIPYMDELSKYIGCDPPYWFSHLPHDPLMAIHALIAPSASYFYRLRGPHAWPGARDAILSIEDRVAKATNPEVKGTIFTLKHAGVTEMNRTLERRKRVCVIGAGGAGLPCIRHALLYGFEVVCYEGQGEIGGLWRYKPEETDESSVMNSTVINTSKELTAYSDFPPKAEEANFMHNRHLYQYFIDYANNFKLNEYIKLWHKVQNVERAADYVKTGRWDVTVTDLKSGSSFTENFDGVLLCTGHHTLPYSPPPWPGQNEFKGQVIHSHSYKDHRGLEDKVVAVVGVGNSGGDVYLVTRRGTWILNRIFDYGRPFDCAMNTRIFNFFRNKLPLWFIDAVVCSRLNKRFDHDLYRLQPKHGVFGAHPTVNDELPNRIAAGTVRVKPQITRFTQRGIEFEDGTKVDEVDTVILATGYSFEFPVLERGELVKVKDNVVDLFEYVFPLSCEHDTLGIIGLIQPLGCIMPIAEMQARVFLDVLAGRSKLPSMEERKAIVQAKHKEMDCRYVKSRRHTIQVDYIPYMDELAEYIGCSPPNWFTYLPSDPIMALHSLFAPVAAYFYRIRGPHPWPGARQAILTIEDRVVKATHPHKSGSIFTVKHTGTSEAMLIGDSTRMFRELLALALAAVLAAQTVEKEYSPLLDQYSAPDNPGIVLRVMPTGLAYMRELGIKVVNEQMLKMALPTIRERIDTGEMMRDILGNDHDFEDLDLTVPLPAAGNFEAQLNNPLLLPSVPIHGTFETLLGHVRLQISVRLSKSDSGAPRVQTAYCKADVGYVDLNVRNTGVITDLFINGFKSFIISQYKPMVEHKMCNMIEQMLDNDMNLMLASMPLKVGLNDDALDVLAATFQGPSQIRRERRSKLPSANNATLLNIVQNLRQQELIMDYALTADPFISYGSIAMAAKGEISWRGQGGTPFNPPTIKLPPPHGVHMIEFYATDYIANSMLYHAYRQRLLDLVIGPESTPALKDLLHTTCTSGYCLGEFLGGLGEQFPDRIVEIRFTSRRAPLIVFVEDRARFRLHGRMNMFLRPKQRGGQPEMIIRADTTMTSNVKLWLNDRHVVGNATIENLDFRLIESRVNDVDQSVFGDLGLFGAEFLEQLLTEILQLGIALPTMKGIVLKSPKQTLSTGSGQRRGFFRVKR